MRRYLILIISIYLVLMQILLVGCEREESDLDRFSSLYSTDLNDLEEKYRKNIKEDISKESELPYQLKATVDYKEENITYILILKNPKNNMNSVYISYMPSLELMDSLYAVSLLVTTVNNHNPINLDPVDIKQYTVGGSFVINESKIDDNFKSNYQRVLVKVTWVDDIKEKQTRYCYVDATPTQNMNDFILNK